MIIYKTTNLINNKIYVGKDTNNNDKYLGSGLLLQNAILKYGKQNFTKEILQICNNLIELNDAEIYWIKHYNSTDKNIGYNISLGGNGGDTYTNNPKLNEIKEKFKGDKNPFFGKKHNENTHKIISDTHKGKIPWNKNKINIYSLETLEKMSNSKKELRLDINLTELKTTFELLNKNKAKTAKTLNISLNTLNHRLFLIYGKNTNFKKKGGQ